MSESTHRLLRFGMYELNLDTQELRNAGTLVKLPPQPLRVLAMLASRAGQTTTRDEIQKQLWGEDTYVDFDQGVNKCIKQIRAVLNDNADRPLYIETLPRRGYRFVAPVVSKSIPAPSPKITESTSDFVGRLSAAVAARLHVAEATGSASQVPSARTVRPIQDLPPTVVDLVGEGAQSCQEPVPALTPRRIFTGLLLKWVMAGICTILGISLALFSYRRPRREGPSITKNDTVVLADFVNSTGDPLFDDTLKQALAIELEQSPYLSILSDRAVLKNLELMNLSADQRLTQQVAIEVCLRSNSRAVFIGSIAQEEERYKMGVRVLNCETGNLIATSEAVAENRAQVLPVLGGVGNQLRKTLGESLVSIQSFSQPLEVATTGSLEALQAYTRGRILQVSRIADPLIYFKKAVELDPNFAYAYASLGTYYKNLGEMRLATENYNKAFELRERVSSREQYYIESHYYEDVTGELENAIKTYTDWIANYPRDYIPHNNLAEIYNTVGSYEKAASEAQQSIVLMKENVNAYLGLMRSYILLDRPDEGKAVYQQAKERKLSLSALSPALYYLFFLSNDQDGMKGAFDVAMGRPGLEDQLLSSQSDTEAYYGRLGKARGLSERAVMSARKAQAPETAALWRANEALRDAELGFADTARSKIAEALSMSNSTTIRGIAAMTLARAGQSAEATHLADQLSKEAPVSTVMQAYLLPSIRGAVELEKRNASRAIDLLEVSIPYENGDAGIATANFGNLYPVFIRGLAYLQMKKPDLAAAEFRKIVDHRGATTNFVVGPLARLYLGRAQQLSGDIRDARRDYQDFFALWKDADSEIPILKTAQSDYLSLH